MILWLKQGNYGLLEVRQSLKKAHEREVVRRHRSKVTLYLSIAQLFFSFSIKSTKTDE